MGLRTHLGTDQCAQDLSKKLITSEIFCLAREGQTSNPFFIDVITARKINQFFGAPVIIPQVSDELIEVVDGLTEDLPKMQSGLKNVEDIFAKWRNQCGYKHGK